MYFGWLALEFISVRLGAAAKRDNNFYLIVTNFFGHTLYRKENYNTNSTLENHDDPSSRSSCIVVVVVVAVANFAIPLIAAGRESKESSHGRSVRRRRSIFCATIDFFLEQTSFTKSIHLSTCCSFS